MMQSTMASITKAILWVPCDSTLKPLGFSFFFSSLRRMEQEQMEVMPWALTTEEGNRMKMKVFQVLPAVTGKLRLVLIPTTTSTADILIYWGQ